jgi:repressor LexA
MLTHVQNRAYQFIASRLAETGCSPTYREIAAHCGYANVSSAHSVVSTLVARRKVHRLPGRANGLSIPKSRYYWPTSDGRPWVREIFP